jgi:hypothetical protein
MQKTAKTPRNVPASQRVAVDLPETGFEVIQYFNRFGVERVDEQNVVHFGYATKAGEVISSYSTILPDAFVANSRPDWLEYLGRIGSAPEGTADLTWRPPASRAGQKITVTNAIRLGRTGREAEIRCYCVSLVSIIDSQKNQTILSKTIPAQPLALLQSAADLQQLLLLALVRNETPQ